MALLNLHRRLRRSLVEGPGARYVLWVQGCLLRCPGCCNPHSHALQPRELVDSQCILDELVEEHGRGALEGVTFLGGEPMLQAAALAELAGAARALGLSTMVFTGYRLEDLPSLGFRGIDALLRETDVLVDGAYDASQPELERHWVGSRNQRFHCLSARYSPGFEYSARELRGLELRYRDGVLSINGWPGGVQGFDEG